MTSDEEYRKIKKWVAINKHVIEDIYQHFLYICNEKYQLDIYPSKYLYNDLCIYFYHTLRDDSGSVLYDDCDRISDQI